MGKSKSRKLTDAICRDLPRLDKKYYKPGDYPGLQFWVLPSGTKTWYFQYNSKAKKYQKRKHLGKFPHVGVLEATKLAKAISLKIFHGTDPEEKEKSDTMKMQLGEAIKNYYAEELTEANRHRPKTIKNIKAIFKVWIFRNTYDKTILETLLRADDLQYKKLSSINPKMFKSLFNIVGKKSPTTANRLQNYLRKFWNDYVQESDNPFKIKKKYMFDENEYMDFLDPTELKIVMKNLVQIDDRTGRFNKEYYKRNKLNPVSCLLIALLLTTGRRPEEASSLTWGQYLQGDEPRIRLFKTKTSKKNKKKIFKLGDEAVKILRLIITDRTNNPESKFYYDINDPRNNYIFPSRDYGRKLGTGKCKSLHIIEPNKTWDKVLRMSGVERQMKFYATRHTFATNFYKATKDLKALAEALGTTEKTASKYAKLVGGTMVDGINKINFFDDEKPVLKQVN